MKIAANAMVGLVALAHVWFLILEMFIWDTALGAQLLSRPREVLHSSAVLAMNQGLYNGFLAAGLIWGLVAKRRDVTLFFLGCVIVAGVFGAATAGISIFFLQAAPALIALALVVLASRSADSEKTTDSRA